MYGVEIVPQAIADAKVNAQINGIENVQFFVGKAEEVLPAEYKEHGVYADVIVVDPHARGAMRHYYRQSQICSQSGWST